MKAPAVSVLMTVYNGGKALSPSLESISNQTFADWEMVVVDDASTDGTRDVVEGWSRRDPRIRLVSNGGNKGQTPCLNQGLRECRGTWVARQDADDLSAPGRLAAQIEHVVRNPEVILLGTAGILIDESGHKAGLLDVPCTAAGIAWASLFLNPFLHTSVLFRREAALEAFGGYDESFRIAQDYDLWVRMLNAAPTANIPARLVSYRRSDASLSRSGRDLAMQEADRVSLRQFARLLGRSPAEEEASLCRAFRSGLPAGRRGEFLELLRRLGGEFSARHPDWAAGPGSVAASWRLRLAGSCGKGPSAAVEVLSAFAADPGFVLRWMCDRLG